LSAQRSSVALALAAVAGVVVWFLATLAIPRKEPWDAGLYWALFCPLAVAASAALAYRNPYRPGLIALVAFEAQFLAMCVRNGELGNLWPMGMLLFAVIALPAVAAATLAARASPFKSG
jgi:hypothetical protein